MTEWRTAIANSDKDNIWLRGYEIGPLMQRLTFAEAIFLLHQGRLPSKAEGRLLDAILIAVADHGPGAPSAAAARLAASGNRKALSSAIAAGVSTIGDEHGGAGMACMEMIGAGVSLARSQSISVAEAAQRFVADALGRQQRIPGLGHRVHTHDPRTDILFSMAHENGLSGDGVAFMIAVQQAASEHIKPMPINIDGALAAILFDLNLPAMFSQWIFIIGRVAGLTAEVGEELAREKPMRIRIPVTYDGPPPRRLKE